MAETIKKCFDEKNVRFINELQIIDSNEFKINDIFDITQILNTIKSQIIVPVLNEIIDSDFFESLIKFIADKSEKEKYFSTFELVK